MPKRARRTAPKRYRRRKRRRTVKRRNKVVTLSRIIPPKIIHKLRYATQITLDPGIGTASKYSFRANGMFDPDQSGIGHQPMGFDELMLMYNHYHVLGSKIKVFATMPYDAISNQVFVGVKTGPENVITNLALTSLLEEKKSTYKMLMPARHGRNTGTLVKGYSAKRQFGGNVLSKSELKGDVSNDPTEQTYFHIWAAGKVPSDNPQALSVTVIIDYIAMFTEAKPLLPS